MRGMYEKGKLLIKSLMAHALHRKQAGKIQHTFMKFATCCEKKTPVPGQFITLY
jgi:hypothetical protein